MNGIYKITNPNGRIYIGQSMDIRLRWRDYKFSKTQPRLNRSFNKHGIENHIFEVVEKCSIEEINDRENYWQKYYDVLGENGLNCLITDPNTKKRLYTDEVKKKLSEGRMGSKNHAFGKKRSKRICDIISKTHKGKKVSQETKDKRRKTLGTKQCGGGNPRARKVVCILTGIQFGCITDCANHLGMNRKTLNDQLIGKYPNKTSFVLLENITDGGI